MACHNCGRTFLPDRLEIHLRSCDKAYSKKKGEEEKSTAMHSSVGSIGGGGSNFSTPNLNNKAMKGDTQNCSLCGRQFNKNIME
jgi:hypothetical protein